MRIAIIGCGIAGSTCAILLRRQGYDVQIFEQANQLGPVGAGVMLQPIGQCVLKKIGLLDEVIANSEPIHELHAIYRSGRTLIRMPFSASGLSLHAYGVHRGDIFAVLLQHLYRERVTINLNAAIENTLVNSDGTVTLVNGDGSYFPGFDQVIVANGAKCGLRATHDFKSNVHDYNYGAIWCVLPSKVVSGKLLQIVKGSHQLMGLLPVGRERVSLFWGIPCRDLSSYMNRDVEDWKSEMCTYYPPATSTVAAISDWSQVTYSTFHRGHVSPLFDAKHIFLGDAAHSSSPHLGQGLNFALLDAYRFVHSLEIKKNWQDACHYFENERRNHTRYYEYLTAFLTPFFQSDGYIRAILRDCSLPWIYRMPIIRGQMALTMTGLKSGFFGRQMKIE